MSQSEQHKKGWRRNELGGRECGILPARTDQTRLRQNGDTLCAPKNLKRDKRSADKNSLLLLLKNNQSIVYQSRRSFLFINRRPNERDETREHETAREKATHAKKNDSSRGGRVPAIFERVFSRAFLDDVLFAFFSFFFVLFWHLGDKSSLLKFFKARKKEEKKRGLWSPKSQNKSSLKKTRRSRKHNIGTRRDRL